MSSPLWTIDALAAAADAKRDGDTPLQVSGVSIDSRSIARGDLFVALAAERDGHDFVSAAFKAGAAAALVRSGYSRAAGDGTLLRVDDTLAALGRIGRAARVRCNARIAAVTGSVGKTGTKEMLRVCLEALAPGQTHAPVKSFNNHWGVPLTLARMPASTRLAVFEIGMNHAGEITPLTRMVEPHVAVVTTVEPVHIEFFDSLDGIADAKAEIFLGVKPGGTAVVNADNAYRARLSDRARSLGLSVVTFGRTADASVRLVSAEPAPHGSTVTADVHGRVLNYRIGAPGLHYVQNSLAVLAALAALGLDPAVATQALPHIAAPAGRGAREIITVSGGTILLIDESYNANPASVRAALSVLASVPRTEFPRRIAILGDMRELGAASDTLHRELWPQVDSSGTDLVFACGRHMRGLYDQVPEHRRGGWSQTSGELVAHVAAGVRSGDAVMIKGSLGTNMAPLVAAVRALGRAGT
jgi:UDP-N-acetylmuramoyl-tripeptide--D-alanyl-D-alanine ligase